MKHIFISALLIVNSIFALFAPISRDSTNIDEFLEPYIQIIESVNSTTGSCFCIPKENKEEAYLALQQYEPEEFENYLRESYEQLISMSEVICSQNYGENNSNKVNPILHNTIIDNYLQMVTLDNYGTIVKVYSQLEGYGSPIRYRYKRINRVTLSIMKEYKGFYLEPMGNAVNTTIGDNGESCTVEFDGYPKSSTGVVLNLLVKFKYTFYAN